jgi:hypothetical protein
MRATQKRLVFVSTLHEHSNCSPFAYVRQAGLLERNLPKKGEKPQGPLAELSRWSTKERKQKSQKSGKNNQRTVARFKVLPYSYGFCCLCHLCRAPPSSFVGCDGGVNREPCSDRSDGPAGADWGLPNRPLLPRGHFFYLSHLLWKRRYF